MRFKTTVIFLIVLLAALPLLAQQNGNAVQQEAFSPYETGPGTPYRSASGAPGEAYWQNTADYEMDVQLHPEEHKLTNTVTIHYTNNSPQELGFLWLKLDQNLFKNESWGAKVTPYTGSRFGNQNFDGGLTIAEITVEHNGKSYQPEQHPMDTNMKLNLNEALAAEGGEVSITVDYSFVIPEYGSDRLGRLDTKNGTIYEIAQWYPRIAVFDDIKGWNVRPYLASRRQVDGGV